MGEMLDGLGLSGDGMPRRHLIGRQLLQAASPNVTIVTSSSEQIPTWVVITVAGSVGAVACILLIVLIVVLLMQRRGMKAGRAGAHSGSGPSKQLLSNPGSNEDVERQLIPKREMIPREADGWPFCLHPIEQVPMTVENKMPKYSLAEVRRATGDFAEDGLLGEGRYGGVFRGTLDDGRPVAVKRMRVEHVRGELTKFGNRAEKEFLSEAEVIVRVHHRHLLPLIGYCSTRDERILILMYMGRGSLEAKLRDRRNSLDWGARYRIAVGAAKGIAYLHEDCLPGILHRDIKTSNILLDESDEPRVADFGFARSKEFGKLSGSVQTQVVGTPGYLPIECVLFGQNNSIKSDVYAFGVVLLEILSGKPPVEGEAGSKKTLAHFAKETHDYGGGLADVIDPALGRSYDVDEAVRLWHTALHCVSDDPIRRPRMGHVVLMLRGKQPALPPSPEVQRLGNFARASPRDRNPRNIVTPEKVDLWPRAAESPLARKFTPPSPGNVLRNLQSPHSRESKSRESRSRDSRSTVEHRRMDTDTEYEMRPESSESQKRSTPDYHHFLYENEDGEKVVLVDGVDTGVLTDGAKRKRSPGGFNRAEYDPVEQFSGEVWKDDDMDGLDMSKLRWTPGQPLMHYWAGPPGGDTLQEARRDTWQGAVPAGDAPPIGEPWGAESTSDGAGAVAPQIRGFGESADGYSKIMVKSHSERYSVRTEEAGWPEMGAESADWGKRKLTRSLSNPLFVGEGGGHPLFGEEDGEGTNPLFIEKVATPEDPFLSGKGFTYLEVQSRSSSHSSPLENASPLPKVY